MPNRNKIKAHGLVALLASHPEVRRLKRLYAPSVHGNKFWKSSWLLIDYFSHRGLPPGARVMEVGCGWGLASIYCAKKHQAVVTCVDIDDEVFPYLRLHAARNDVRVQTMRKGFDALRIRDLEQVDVLIGADICFWDRMTDALRRLIGRALKAGVKMVLISDPGRPPFETLQKYFVQRQQGEALEWTAQRPRRTQGQLLRIGSLTDLEHHS
jgi:predicted nicotinamide N-methyase